MTKQEAADLFGELDLEGCIASATAKFSGFPWYLAGWYCDGYHDEFIGDVDAIGYYESFSVSASEAATLGIDANIVGYIVRENSDGFMNYEEYTSIPAMRSAWAGIEKEYEAFYASIRDEEEVTQ